MIAGAQLAEEGGEDEECGHEGGRQWTAPGYVGWKEKYLAMGPPWGACEKGSVKNDPWILAVELRSYPHS